MILKIDLHTHTNRYSSCSRLTPERLCQIALKRGLDAIAITEHDYQWSKSEVAELQARYPALKIYAGVEISCDDRHHYGVLGLEANDYTPAPMPYRQFKALIGAHPAALAFIAHCFRYSDDETGLEDKPVEGIELGNWNLLTHPQPDTGPITFKRPELHLKWQQRMGWIPLHNSDGHAEKMVGTFYNLVQADRMPPDEQALVQLLRRAEIHGFCDEALIRQSINVYP